MVEEIKGNSSHPYVCVIGGANIDIIGKSYTSLLPATSNPGEVQLSLGGVGRNIAHNLHNLEIESYLITAIGRDFYGEKLLAECKKIGIHMEHSLVVEDGSTGLYLAILDDTGEMVTAIAQMNIFDKIDEEFLEGKKEFLQKAKVLVVDTNIPQGAIEYIIGLAKEKEIPLFLDTVSIAKTIKVKEMIGGFHTIKPNLLELELLTDRKINCEETMKEATEILLEKGVKEVVVSLGKDGAFYHNGKKFGKMKGFDFQVKNTTGAGDSFLAGLVYGTLLGKKIEEKVKLALGCGALTINTYETVSQEINPKRLEEFCSRE